MTVLRQRMLDDMRIRNLAAETQTSYLRQVAKFARYHGQSPELLGPEDIRDRYVMLSPTLLQQLRAWWRVERPARWLFPGRHPEQPMQKGTVQWACRLARYRSRLGEPVTPHSLRHAFAVHLLEVGTDVRTIQLLLGHRRLETTARYLRLATTKVCSATSPLDLLPRPETASVPRTDRGPLWLVRSFAWRRSSASTATCIVPGPGPRCRPRTCA